MEIFYDSEYAEKLTRLVYQKFMEGNEDRNEIHMSDLCYCPMKVWNRLSGIEPLPFSDRSVGFMMIGQVGQEIIQNVFPESWAEYEPDPELSSHIDVFVQEDDEPDFPLEIKFSRRSVYRGADIPEPWLLQCTGYMALTESLVGRFAVFNVMDAKINCFKVVLSPLELEVRKDNIDKFKALIRKAVDEKDPYLLDINIGECKYCDYRDTRTRNKYDVGRGCPRYKGRTTKSLDLFLPSSSEEQPEHQEEQ
jgi:CRISPR/Cas system-associated exonuclease Cas4 (RecB family)